MKISKNINKIINKRAKVEKVNNQRKRKISSSRWLARQINDPFVQEAKALGYRSRASFKIMEIDEKFKIFQKGQKVLDLGSAPGGWSQVVVKKVGEGNVLALDILDMPQINGVDFIKYDFLAQNAEKILMDKIGGDKYDVVMSDMASNTTGNKQTDHLRTLNLVENAFYFALKILKQGGTFIAKIFQGGLEKELFEKFKENFEVVKHFKPLSSRKESVEMYIVAMGRK